MNKQLLKDLPELLKAGVINEQTALDIGNFYKQQRTSSPNLLTIILGILGALLVGSGILLVIAHNWDELSRIVKTILSFIPLVGAQALCIYTLLKRTENKGWVECSAVLLFFAVGATISLVSQVYQVSGSLDGFLLTWVLLSLPVVYLLSSSTAAILCLLTITWHAALLGYSGKPDRIPYWYIITLLLLVPHYYLLLTKRPNSNYLNLMNWAIVLSIPITLGSFTYNPGTWFEWLFLLYCILFCIYYLVGQTKFFHGRRLIANPFVVIGMPGIIAILLSWSFSFLWDEQKTAVGFSMFNDPLPYLILAALAAVIILLSKSLRAGSLPDPTAFSFIPLLLLFSFMVAFPAVNMFIINVWILIIALYFIRRGSNEDHFGILNLGLIVLAALSICRFFDDTIPFIWRGLFFVATGAGFFIANYMMLRKRKQLIKSE